MLQSKEGVEPRGGASRALGVALIVIPALVVIGVLTFAAPCGVHEDGSVSPCFAAGRAIPAMGVVALVLAVVRRRAHDRRVSTALDALLLTLGVLIALVPGFILPLCMMETMRCHTIMAPTIRMFGAALALVAGIDLFVGIKGGVA